MKSFYLLFIALAATAIGVWQLNVDANGAHQQRDLIVTTDQSGQDVTADIKQLQTYTANHMNASVSFELSGSYQRAVDAAKAATVPNANGQIYAQAQAACAGRASAVVQAQCVAAYLSAHPGPAAASAPAPIESDYVYSFKSPAWAPDSAGISLAAAALSLIIGTALMIFKRR